MTCPSFDDLLGWHLSPADDGVGGHVGDGCPDCRRRLSLLDELIVSLARPQPVEVPVDLRSATLQQLQALTARPSALDQLREVAGRALERVHEFAEHVAELIELPRSPALAAGLRGDDDAGLRRYAAGPWRLDVGLVERRSLMGQLLDERDGDAVELAGALCTLCAPDRVQETRVDEDGAFRFEAVGPGRYGLMIEADDQRLSFPDVDLILPGE